MTSAIQHWLVVRIRIICVTVFLLGSLLPPYIPATALPTEETPAAGVQFLFVEEGFLMKSSPLSDQGARLAYTEGLVHTVREGESLEKIGQKYGIKKETILWANNLESDAVLRPRMELLIMPVDGVTHVVRRGQTLSGIAELYSVPSDIIARQNNIRGSFIVAGQRLIIPGGKPALPGRPIAGGPLRFGTLEERQIALRSRGGGAGGASTSEEFASAILTELGMPCERCFYTQYYRPGHYAVDMQTKGGGPIYAAEAGVVIRADLGWNGGYGNVIEIDHGNGLVTLYAHNKEHYVTEGDRVSRGQKIAAMGRTGLVHGPTGIHTHFEVRSHGVKKNPLLYLK